MSQATSTHPVSTPATPPAPVDYGRRPAQRKPRVNARMIVFVLVFGAIIGLPIYIYLTAVMTQGITHRADGVIEVDLKAMSTFTLDQSVGKTADIPERYRALDGKKVSLVGEMYAPNAAGSAVGQFDLVYSIAKCCFSGTQLVQHFVKSTPVTPGTGMPYYSGLVRATGTLHVGVTSEDGKVTSVYRLTVDSVDPI